MFDFVHGHVPLDYQRLDQMALALDAFREHVGVSGRFYPSRRRPVSVSGTSRHDMSPAISAVSDAAVPNADGLERLVRSLLDGRWYAFTPGMIERHIGRIVIDRAVTLQTSRSRWS